MTTIDRAGSLRLDAGVLRALEFLPQALDEAVPLSHRHRMELKRDIRRLWEDLAPERERRSAEYLGVPANYSAYIRYFLPWNILRLSSVFRESSLPLKEGSRVVDIGSGPLTVPIALWAARPDLRSVSLEILCSDRTERIMAIGRSVFESLCAKAAASLPPWRITLVRRQFGAPAPEKADLLTAANVFNEFFWKDRQPIGVKAMNTARQLRSYLAPGGSVFLMEPGDPRSGSFISAVRAALMDMGGRPLAPCPHGNACPMPGLFRSPAGMEARQLRPVQMPKWRGKYPWCHFSIDAREAPAWLKDLSDQAGLPKEKLVFSYLLASFAKAAAPGRGETKERDLVRVVSEAFPLPDRGTGRYACSAAGYSLVRYDSRGTDLESGDLIAGGEAGHLPARDEKSGAIILSY